MYLCISLSSLCCFIDFCSIDISIVYLFVFNEKNVLYISVNDTS